MELYLIRHADAVSLEAAQVATDEERPLSELGQVQAQRIGQTFRAQRLRIAFLIASPLLRAKQTALGLVPALAEPPQQMLICPELAPDGKPRRLARYIRSLHAGTVALVGHQPDLGALAAWLIGSKKAQISFAKAGVACIHSDEYVSKGTGELLWHITPDWLVPLAAPTVPGERLS